MSKVTNNLYIGNIDQATDQKWLDYNKITHIVNATQELNNVFPKKYSYLTLFLQDSPYQSLFPSLEKSYNFIENAISKGGNVLVHCYAGVSRSSSVVIYYIMKSQGWSFNKSYFYLKKKHAWANPNPGFINQLVSIDNSYIFIKNIHLIS